MIPKYKPMNVIIAVNPAEQVTERLLCELVETFMPAAEQKEISLVLGENAAGSAVYDYK